MNNQKAETTSRPKKIWIDLDNSPHVLFFQPIIRELKKRGYRVFITARDYAQVIELADLFELDYTQIGRHYGKHTLMKAAGLLVRSAQMLPILLREKPSLALSHGSRSQVLISKLIHTPVATAFDYEYAQPLPFFNPDLALVPEALVEKGISRRAKEMCGYPGIKEDVYVPEFAPDPSIYQALGLNKEKVIVTIRPPATAAHYHVAKSDELFDEVINHLTRQQNVVIVLLPRTRQQGDTIKCAWASDINDGKIIVPNEAVNGLNLLWHSDMAISGGGTLIREAAALGVPAYSIFGGKVGAVDESLEASGRLKLLTSAEDVRTKIVIEKRPLIKGQGNDHCKALASIVNKISAYTDGLN